MAQEKPAQAKPQAESPKPPESIAVTVKKPDIVATTLNTPEFQAATVSISQPTFDILLNNMIFCADIAGQMNGGAGPNPGTVLAELMETIKATGIDMKKPDEVKTVLGKMLKEGGGKAILAAKDLLEWRGGLIAGTSGSRFVEDKKGAPAVTGGTPDKIYSIGNAGFNVSEKPEETGWFGRPKNKKKEAVEGQYHLQMKNSSDFTMIADLQDQQFLTLSGLATGTDLTNIDNKTRLLETMAQMAQARTELFLKTDVKPHEIDVNRLNFINTAGTAYLATRKPHFKGELNANINPTQLATEGKTVLTEIKTEVQKKIKEEIEAAQKSALEDIPAQFTARKEAITAKAQITDADEKARLERLADDEINKVKDQLKVFERHALVDLDITEADKEVKKAQDALNDRQTTVNAAKGVTLDLMLLSGDSTVVGSVVSMEDKLRALKSSLDPENVDLANARADFESLKTAPTSSTFYNRTTIAATGDKEEILNAKGEKAMDDWKIDRDNALLELKRLEKKITKDSWPPGSTGNPSLTRQIAQLEAQIGDYKAILSEEATKTVIDNLNASKKTHKKLTDEKAKVDPEYNALTTGVNTGKNEVSYKTELKNAQEKREQIGKPDKDDMREQEVLEALKIVYSAEGIAQTEKNIQLYERAKAAGVSIKLEYAPEWAAYPKALLEIVQLLYGPEVLWVSPPAGAKTELAKQIHAMFESAQYLDILVDSVEKAGRVSAANQIIDFTPGTATKNTEIKPGNAKNAFSGKAVESVPLTAVNRKIIYAMLERMRKYALGLNP